MLKNINQWKEGSPENLRFFCQRSEAASTIFFKFLEQRILSFSKILESNFYEDLKTKLHYIHLNDTSVVEDEKICKFTEYAIKMGCDDLSNCPEKLCF